MLPEQHQTRQRKQLYIGSLLLCHYLLRTDAVSLLKEALRLTRALFYFTNPGFILC